MRIKLEIYKNKMVLTGDGRILTSVPETPFSTARLLVGNFDSASKCLEVGAKKLNAIGYFKRAPTFDIYPKDLSSGGLSQVEDRILRELAVSVGARKVDIYES